MRPVLLLVALLACDRTEAPPPAPPPLPEAPAKELVKDPPGMRAHVATKLVSNSVMDPEGALTRELKLRQAMFRICLESARVGLDDDQKLTIRAQPDSAITVEAPGAERALPCMQAALDRMVERGLRVTEPAEVEVHYERFYRSATLE